MIEHRLFVYGTLKPGCENDSILKEIFPPYPNSSKKLKVFATILYLVLNFIVLVLEFTLLPLGNFECFFFIGNSNAVGQFLSSQAEFIFIIFSTVGILSIIPAYFSWKRMQGRNL